MNKHFPVHLCDVATVGSGSGFPVVYQGNPNGEYPFLKVSDMNLEGNEIHITRWNNSITECVRQKLRATVFPSGSVIFPKIGAAIATNKKRILSVPSCIDNNVMAVSPNAARLDSEFLFYMLRAKNISDFASDSNPPSMRKTTVEDWQFELPELAKQRRIVDILSRAEGIVRLRREAQKKAAELIPALFLDMFGNPAINPKGWPMSSVGNVIIAADYGSSTKASENGAGVPMIRMGNVDFAGYLKPDDLKYVELSPEDIERYGLSEGDILFNRTNSKDLVGKTGVWDGSRTAVAASYFIRVRVARDKINPFFFWAFMNSAHMKRVLFETARGAIGQSNINARELRAFEIMVPPLNQQNDYEQRCRDVFSIQSQQALAAEKAEATFDALLAGVWRTGELCERDSK